MSSRNRLVALVGVVLLGAAIYATFALMRDDTPSPSASVEAYLDLWAEGDFAAMEEQVVGAPASFVEDHQAFVDGLGVNTLTSADAGAPRGGAVFHDTAVWVARDA